MSDIYKTIDLKQTTQKDELVIVVLQSLEVSFFPFQFVNNNVLSICSEYRTVIRNIQ